MPGLWRFFSKSFIISLQLNGGIMNISLLTPNLEKRINTLIQINDRRAIRKDLIKPTVTLSREFGCEAYPLAKSLMSHLGQKKVDYFDKWNIYDKELIKLISTNENISENFLEHVEQDDRLSDFMATFMAGSLTQSEAYELIAGYIAKIALNGNAIIVGRGSSIITNKFPNCFHFRIVGSLDGRVQSIAKRLDIDHKAAHELVVQKQKERDNFISNYFKTDISDSTIYHAVLNQDKLSLDHMSQIILDVMNSEKDK